MTRRLGESISNSPLLSKFVKPASSSVVSVKLRPDSKTSDKAVLILSGIAVNFSRQKDRFSAQENPPRIYYVTGKFAQLCYLSYNMNKKLFPGLLDAVMQKNDINQVQLHKLTGIAVSRINNYLQAKYRTIKPAHIQAICEKVTSDNPERAELVKTYLLDLLPDAMKNVIEIKALTSVRDFEDWYLRRNRLPRDFAGEFEDLYKMCVSFPRVRVRTGDWIELMKECSAK
jgi:DNA-binding Xre family transcriptional regulator